MKELRPYQQQSIDAIASKYAAGVRSIVFQLATGGGKTITAAALIRRWLAAQPAANPVFGRKAVFLVHREELLDQFRRTMYNQYGVVAEPIVAGKKYANPEYPVYVAMVETAYNRLKKKPDWFGKVGLVIIDEAHLGNFKKIFEFFGSDILRVGLTATPIYASKKHPMKQDYEDIVCGIDIPDLIRQGALVPNRTYSIKSGVDRSQLKVKNGEFDNKEMAREYSKGRHVQNTVEQYRKYADGTKAIVFNVNVEHSLLVTEAFKAAGYPTMHLDGTMPDAERKRILHWFHETPGAVLNNIAVLTAGFDEPSIQTVIMNRSTLSLPLWLQVTGRGSRPAPGKDHFTILDLGGNALQHGDWCTGRDWEHLFRNPAKPSKGGGVGSVKVCIKCEAIIAAAARTCNFCGAEQPITGVEYDKTSVELQLLANDIQVERLVVEKPAGWNPHSVLHRIKADLIKTVRAAQPRVQDAEAYKLLEVYQDKVQEWCKINGKPYNQWYKETTAEWFFEEMKRVFGWEPQKLSLAI